MPVMTTALTGFSSGPNSRTYVAPTHTAVKPRIVVQKRKVASGNAAAEYGINVVYATQDAEGNILNSKVAFECLVRWPLNGQSADNTAALALFKEIIASDEFANNVFGQTWIKG